MFYNKLSPIIFAVKKIHLKHFKTSENPAVCLQTNTLEHK